MLGMDTIEPLTAFELHVRCDSWDYKSNVAYNSSRKSISLGKDQICHLIGPNWQLSYGVFLEQLWSEPYTDLDLEYEKKSNIESYFYDKYMK